MCTTRWNSRGLALGALSAKSTRSVWGACECSVYRLRGRSPGQTRGDEVTRGSGGETHGYGASRHVVGIARGRVLSIGHEFVTVTAMGFMRGAVLATNAIRASWRAAVVMV